MRPSPRGISLDPARTRAAVPIRTGEETLQVDRREALAEETAAKARAVQADAEVKAAHLGLQQQAAAHRSEAGTSRDRLNEQWDRADTLDLADTRNGEVGRADRK